MRILYTHRTQGVGAEGAHVLGMFEAFAELGHEVRMDCLPGCNPAEQKIVPAAQAPSQEPGRVKKPRPSMFQRIYWFIAEHSPETVFELFELAYNIPLFFRLGFRAWIFKPDMIYERYALNTFAPTWISKLAQCRHVIEVNDSVVIERSRPLALKVMAEFCEGHCLRGSDIVITITDRFRELLDRRFSGTAGKILVLPNAISKKRFDRAFDREGMRRMLGISISPEGLGATEGVTTPLPAGVDRFASQFSNSGIRSFPAMVLGASGQFLPWHGLRELVAVMGPKAKELDLHFLFIGDGPVRAEILELAESLGIGSRVRFTGMVPIVKVPEYLAALDIAVIPSAAKHASPMKLMEYMGAGLPIVAPDLPSIRAVLDDPETAAIFPPDDMAAMERELMLLIRNPARTAELGRKAKERIFDSLTWTNHASKIIARLSSFNSVG